MRVLSRASGCSRVRSLPSGHMGLGAVSVTFGEAWHGTHYLAVGEALATKPVIQSSAARPWSVRHPLSSFVISGSRPGPPVPTRSRVGPMAGGILPTRSRTLLTLNSTGLTLTGAKPITTRFLLTSSGTVPLLTGIDPAFSGTVPTARRINPGVGRDNSVSCRIDSGLRSEVPQLDRHRCRSKVASMPLGARTVPSNPESFPLHVTSMPQNARMMPVRIGTVPLGGGPLPQNAGWTPRNSRPLPRRGRWIPLAGAPVGAKQGQESCT